MSFLGEIKRRKAFQVAAVYLVVAWLIMQVVDVVNEPLLLPDWFARVVILLLAVGFPIVLITSWAFDLTPEGVVRDEGSNDAAHRSGRKIELVLIGLLVLAVGFMFVDNYVVEQASDMELAAGNAVEAVPLAVIEQQGEVLANSVAVLPFENLNPDAEDEWFATGLHDELLNRLAKIRDLNVIARTSMLRYAVTELTLSEIADELNVQTIMEGTVRYAEGSVRVTTQLIDAATESHLWSATYTRPFANIFEIETDIATQIASALEIEFSLTEQQSVAATPSPNSPEAFAIYVRAIEVWQSTGPTPGILARVRDDLKRAIDLDPEFAQPHAVLADIYAEKLFTDIGTPENWQTQREELVGLAVHHAERALELDPNLGYAYAALGKVHAQYWRETEARAAFQRALELSPNDPEVLIENAWFYSYAGEHIQAVNVAERAVALDPGNGDLLNRLGEILAMAQEHDRALLVNRQAVSVEPSRALNYLFIGADQAWQGNYAEAVDALRLAEQLFGDIQSGFILATLAYHYGLAMSSDDASRVFERLTDVADVRRVGHLSWAMAYLAIDDQEQVLEQLSWAAESKLPDEGAFFFGYFTNNLWGDPVLEQPDFVEVRGRLGFSD